MKLKPAVLRAPLVDVRPPATSGPAAEAAACAGQVIRGHYWADLVAPVHDGPDRVRVRLEVEAVRVAQAAGADPGAPRSYVQIARREPTVA
jgi:hypothetical protein